MIKTIASILGCLAVAANAYNGLSLTTVGEYLADFDGEDFTGDFNAMPAALTPALGAVGQSVATHPALYATQIQAVKLILEPCGIIPIHTHPRADEFFYLLKGDNFKNFFIHESGPKSNTIKAGESFIFPMGYVHGQINDSCEPAEGIASLNSYDAGVLLLAPGLVSLDNDQLGPNFDNRAGVFRSLAKIPDSISYDGECLARCGL